MRLLGPPFTLDPLAIPSRHPQEGPSGLFPSAYARDLTEEEWQFVPPAFHSARFVRFKGVSPGAIEPAGTPPSRLTRCPVVYPGAGHQQQAELASGGAEACSRG